MGHFRVALTQPGCAADAAYANLAARKPRMRNPFSKGADESRVGRQCTRAL